MNVRRTQFGKINKPSGKGGKTPRQPPFGTSAADGFAQGDRGALSGANLEQNRAVGIDDPAGGSRQGREQNKADPGEPSSKDGL